MSNFIFWCLKRLAILTIKYTKHPNGAFQLGASVCVNGKRYPFTFESNMNVNKNQKLQGAGMKIDLDASCCGKCFYYNGDMNDNQAFCDEREDFVSKGYYCYRYEEDETKEQKNE